MRDPEIRIEPLPGVENGYDIMIPHRCVHLADLPDDRTECDLQDTDKPAMCRNFPTANDTLEPGCGFHFDSER